MKNKDKKKNGAGSLQVLDGGDQPAPTAPPIATIELKPEEKAQLLAAEQALGNTKIFLANAQIQVMQAEAQRNELAQKVMQLHEEYMLLIRKLATANGIDVDADPAKVRWDLNTTQGVFSRLA